MKRIAQILLVALPGIATNLFSQTTNLLWYNQLSQAEGLSSQDYNFYAYSDSEGFTWLSSTEGLNRFDGRQVKQYRSDFRDSTALYGENIQSRFFEDARHNLWFCTYEAVHCYNRSQDNFQHFFIRDGTGEPLREDYYVFCLEQDSMLWFRAGHGIYRVNIAVPARTRQGFEAAKPLFSNGRFHSAAGLAEDGSVQYVFSFSNEKHAGLDCFEIHRGVLVQQQAFFEKTSGRVPELSVFQTHFEDREHIWLTTDKGLVEWSLLRADSVRLFPFAFQGYAYLEPYGARYFLVSFSANGLFLFDKTTGQYAPFQLRPILRRDDKEEALNIRNIYLDRHQVLWMTRPYEGVVYANLQKRKFDALPIPGFLRAAKPLFRNFAEDRNGRVWCSYNGGLLEMDQAGHFIDHVSIAGKAPAHPSIKFILPDSANGIWVATNKGLLLYTPAKRIFHTIPGTEKTDFLYLYRLAGGPVLVTSLFGGVFELQKTNGKWALHGVCPPDMGYTAMYQDRSGRIYICRNEAEIAVFSYRGDSLRLEETLPVRGAVNAFYEAPGGQTLWVGTSFGLAKIDRRLPGATPVLYTQKEGLPDNNVLHILPGPANRLWISTSAGLASFDPETGACRHYTLADGAQSEHFDKYAGLQLSAGALWFGGSAGITVIPSRAVRDIETKAAVVLTGIWVNDQAPARIRCTRTGAGSINEARRLEYPFRENTLSFSFVAIDNAYPAGTRVQYQMKGVDKDWVTLQNGEPGFARYPGLAAGTYEFLVRGANSDGVWNGMPHRLQIRILPPYWATWWFRTLLGLAAAGLASGAVLYRINQIRKTEQLKRRIAENKMAALIAQMNPHFIFNSLQSINSYILKNNRKQASEYLGRFSRLMRMILENSRRSMHPLDKERELLELYLKVESQRFKTPFQYSIDIDEALDPYEVQVPCMMLQPFVENAIWHGLSPKKEPGSIRVEIRADGDLLKCAVTDDGVGRAKAAEIALNKGKTHESAALQILGERLRLLFPRQQDRCSIVYTDLFDPGGQAAGTRVEISLPMTNDQ